MFYCILFFLLVIFFVVFSCLRTAPSLLISNPETSFFMLKVRRFYALKISEANDKWLHW